MQNLSTKEVNYMKDILSWELLSAKKCFQYAHQETDPNNQKFFFDAANMHQYNYQRLLGFAEKMNNLQGGQMQ